MKKCIFLGDWVMEEMVGIQRYTYQILLTLDKLISEGNITFKIELLVPTNASWIPKFKNIIIVKKGKINTKVQKHLWQQLIFPLYIKKEDGLGIDLTTAFPIWGCKIYAIHDCIHEAFPENFSDHKFFLKFLILKKSIITRFKKCKIVTLTNNSRDEVLKYYPKAKGRVSLVTCGWEHMIERGTNDSIFQKLNIQKDENYYFALGSKYKHKNFKWVLSAARNNKEEKFVITGTGQFSSNEKELSNEAPENVIFTGYISDEEIKSLMVHCRALIQPSLYEGFGLPPLEALSVGANIIISNASCLPEVYKDSAYYIDPFSDKVDLKTLISKEIVDSSYILSEYSWIKAGLQLCKVIDEL